MWMAVGQAFSLSFSHELHLKLKLTCTSCHAAAPKSTRLEDNLLPRKEACLGCHKKAVIKTPSSTLLSRFNHRKHVAMGNLAPVIRAAIDSKAYLGAAGDMRRHLNGNNACAACHRGMEESTAVSKANFPQMADCLVCHNKIDPPFSCEFCHARNAKLKPASHVADYVDKHHNKAIEKTSCAVCHGRKFTCLGCH